MNFTIITEKIKDNTLKAVDYIKYIYSLPDSGKYFIAAFILIILFTFLTFPYEQIIQKKIHEGEGKTFSSADITGLDIGIIGKTYLEKLELGFPDSTDLSIEKGVFNLSTNPYRIFVSRRIKTGIQMQTFRYSGKETEFWGTVTGNIDLTLNNKSGTPENGSVEISFSQAVLQIGTINIPTSMGSFPLKIGVINIQSLDFGANVVNRVMRINKFTINSNELKCSFSGNITIEPIIKNSRLDLRLNIDTQSSVFDEQRDIVNAFTKNSPLEIIINGTLGRPEFKTTKAGSDKNEN